MTPVQGVEVALWLGCGWTQVEFIGSGSYAATTHVGVRRQRQKLTHEQHLHHTTTSHEPHTQYSLHTTASTRARA